MFNNRQKKTIGVILIITGILVPLASVPLSSAYGDHGSLLWCLVRVIWTGEIVFREGTVKVVPDRDEQLYAEFIEYRRDHRELKSLPEDQIVERFYNARYKDRMPRVLFNLKFEKKQVMTIQRKIAVSNRYIFVAGVLLVIAGEGIRILARKKNS